MNDETTKEIEDLSTLACSTDEVQRKRALGALLGRVVGRLYNGAISDPLRALHEEMDRANVPERGAPLEDRVRSLWQERDAHKANAETLARDLAEARADVDRLIARLPLETVLQCLGGVLNDMTRGGLVASPDAQRFRDDATMRLRSLAGSPEKEERALMVEEFSGLAKASRMVFERWDGDIMESHRAMLRWMEEEGYLSVRLPPQE